MNNELSFKLKYTSCQATIGITGCHLCRAPIDRDTYHLDVGLFLPIGAAANKRGSVRPLKEYMI